MIENLNDFLPVHHLFDIAVQISQALLLAGIILLTSLAAEFDV